MTDELGKRIQAARRKAGYRNAEQFAEALGVSTATVARIEQGRHDLALSRLGRIAELTGTPVSALLNGEQAA